MRHFLSKLVKRLPDFWKIRVRLAVHALGIYSRKSYSQEGEDIVLEKIFGARQKNGFYVDVGAHHPSRYSNTFYFYRKGWRGINIDAMPGSMRIFDMTRPRDINIETAISDKDEILDFHTFDEPLLNSADIKLSESREKLFGEVKTYPVHARPLGTILEQYMPAGIQIDFMSVDVEGLDLAVLMSNNWIKFRPKYVLVEILGHSIQSMTDTDIYRFLDDLGYEPLAKLIHTVIFKDRNIKNLTYI